MKKILLVPKITKVERYIHRLNLAKEQLKEFYKKENLNAERIFDSHIKQKDSFLKVKNLFKNSEIVGRNELARDLVKDYDLVVSFGGDITSMTKELYVLLSAFAFFFVASVIARQTTRRYV